MFFDWVKCYYPLPDEMAQDLIFKTTSFHRINMTYEISREGKLLLPRYDENDKLYKKNRFSWNGKIYIDGCAHYVGDYFFAYRINFNKGQVTKIETAQPFQD